MTKSDIKITISAAIGGGEGGDPGDIHEDGAGFVDFCCQFLARAGVGNWIAFALL